MDIIKHTTIPLLVFYGELDRNIDPVQGAEAYEDALQTAGNQEYQIQVIGMCLCPRKPAAWVNPAGAAMPLNTWNWWKSGL